VNCSTSQRPLTFCIVTRSWLVLGCALGCALLVVLWSTNTRTVTSFREESTAAATGTAAFVTVFCFVALGPIS